jgi:hypothetical protein
MRLLSDRSHLAAALPPRFGLGIDRPAGRLGRLAFLRDLGHPGSQVVDGPLDRLLGQLPVQRPVDDVRPGVLELDQHAGSAGLVNVALREPDRRRAVRVAVECLWSVAASSSDASIFLPSRRSAIS